MSRKIFHHRAEAGPELVVAFSPHALAVLLLCGLTMRSRITADPTGGMRRPMISSAWLSLLLESVVQNGPERSRARR
jgi:hypothetical protein